MMRYNPTLLVKRLVVERNQKAVYDEAFHVGVNVIRGENSSGKSTVLNFIYYGLGGDLADWSEIALLCTRVIVEVSLNGRDATFSRDISEQIGQPMEIFGGSYEASQYAPRADWVRYPYRRSTNQESFSQTIFRLLGIPEVANDVSGNLTMHQLMRLLYSDQLSPVESLFRFEGRFDPPVLRDAIGRLLAGGYDSRIYENDIKLRELIREFDSKNAELRSLFLVLGATGQDLTVLWVAGERHRLVSERNSIQTQIEEVETQLHTNSKNDAISLRAQNSAYEAVKHSQQKLGDARSKRDAVLLAIADSDAFIATLEQKITALTDANLTAQYIGDVRFNTCPACFAEIEEGQKASTESCHLCRTPFDSKRANERIVSIINDTALQIRQSRLLQTKRKETLERLTADLFEIERIWRESSAKLSSLQRLPSTEIQLKLRDLVRKSGYVDRQIEDLEERARIIQLVARLSEDKNYLNEKITKLRSENEALRSSQQRRIEFSYTLIAREIRDLLHRDLRRQDSFENAENVSFDFGANRISVDGHSYFSASSRVILKSSFFLGFLSAAMKDKEFRHPRFVMIDTIEDKGMEPERSHNFQNLILDVSMKSNVEHQIIYATAMIAPDLDDEQYLVGKFSTRDSPTIDIQT